MLGWLEGTPLSSLGVDGQLGAGADAWAAPSCLPLAADASSRAWNDWGADESKWEDVSLPSEGTSRAKKRQPSGGWDEDW